MNEIETQNLQQQEKAQALLKMKMMEKILKDSFGDGMEFEIVYQAMIDSMTDASSESGLAALLSGTNESDGQNYEELSSLLSNGLTYNSNTNRVNTSTYTGSDTNMNEIYDAVNKYSKEYGVDSKLVLSIIKTESNFNPTVVSSAGAQGLMQLMPENSKAKGVSNPFDIEQNIKGGIELFKGYLNSYGGNVEMALMAYNGGPGTMQRRGVTSASDLYKMPEETQNYIPKVMNYYSTGI